MYRQINLEIFWTSDNRTDRHGKPVPNPVGWEESSEKRNLSPNCCLSLSLLCWSSRGSAGVWFIGQKIFTIHCAIGKFTAHSADIVILPKPRSRSSAQEKTNTTINHCGLKNLFKQHTQADYKLWVYSYRSRI